jgi:hypothetical protein
LFENLGYVIMLPEHQALLDKHGLIYKDPTKEYTDTVLIVKPNPPKQPGEYGYGWVDDHSIVFSATWSLMPTNCGMGIIHEFYIYEPFISDKELWPMLNHLIIDYGHRARSNSALIATHKSNSIIVDILKSGGWQVVSEFTNANSDNDITVLMITF